MPRRSLLEILNERGHANAAGLILAGRVRVNGERETRSGVPVADDALVEVLAGREYPGRGAHKLLGALQVAGENAPDLKGRICVDLGASHGGFTRVLLEKGAARVYAIDVAYGILEYELRRDARVVALEKHNARHLSAQWFAPEDLAAAAGDARGLFVTGDLSFISSRPVLAALAEFRKVAMPPLPRLEIFLLIKPQFERSSATEGGVIKDEGEREQILNEVRERAAELGYRTLATIPSPLAGAKGNREIFLHAVLGD